MNVINDIDKKNDRKSNIIFGILCTILCVAIAVTSALSVFNVMDFLRKPIETEEPEQTVQAVQSVPYVPNIYTQMSPHYDTTGFPANMTSDFAQLYASNDDIIGWLYIPGTNINTPIVQAKDNNKYLRYNFYGSYTNFGTTYADFRTKSDILSTNTVIFGHNMPSGTHFYDVHRFESIDWYKAHPTIIYSTLYGTYTFLISNVFYSTGTAKNDGGYSFNYIYPNIGYNSMSGYIQQINQRTIYKTGIDVIPSDKIITLSTCSHSLDAACGMDIDGRLVVVGRMLRAGESADIDTSKATANPDYRRPHIWYERKGKANPYATYVTWQPTQQ